MKKLLIIFTLILVGCSSTQQHKTKTQEQNFIELVSYDLAYRQSVPGYITNQNNIVIITSLSDKLGDLESNGYIQNYAKYAPGLGYSKKYNKKGIRIHADVFTYHLRMQNIQNGISSKEFNIAYNDMVNSIKTSKVYENLEEFNEKTTHIKGINKKIPFKQFTFKGKHADTGDVLISHTFITCHFNTILKVRISYGENIKNQGEQMMNKFISELATNLVDFNGKVSDFEKWKNNQTSI